MSGFQSNRQLITANNPKLPVCCVFLSVVFLLQKLNGAD